MRVEIKYSIALIGGIWVAEYHMTYKEIASIIDEAIGTVEKQQILRAYQPAIMAAITGDYEQDNLKEVPEVIALWENLIAEPSQLLLGTRYIRIQGTMIEVIKLALTSGFVDAMIKLMSEGPVGYSVSLGATVAITLYELFGKASKLEDDDFCIYLQATTHYHQHKAFTEDDLKDWFPHGGNTVCNMHNSTWRCDYLRDDDSCGIDRQKIQDAVKSLMAKGILEREKGDDNKYTFCFKR